MAIRLARLLLRRCPPQLPTVSCEGVIQLQLKTLSHIAVINLVMQLICYFPRVCLEVRFDSEGILEDPGQPQRELMLRLLAEQGLC